MALNESTGSLFITRMEAIYVYPKRWKVEFDACGPLEAIPAAFRHKLRSQAYRRHSDVGLIFLPNLYVGLALLWVTNHDPPFSGQQRFPSPLRICYFDGGRPPEISRSKIEETFGQCPLEPPQSVPFRIDQLCSVGPAIGV